MIRLSKMSLCFLASLGFSFIHPIQRTFRSSFSEGSKKAQKIRTDDTYNEEKQVPGFKVNKVFAPTIDNFSKFYKFYTSPGFGSGVYVADVFQNEPFDSKVYEVKLIDNSIKYYDYAGYDSLKTKKYVREFLYEKDCLTKDFYVPTDSEAAEIISNSSSIEKSNERYHSLITSISTESSYKSSLPYIQTYSSARKAGDVDTQSVLDHYLSIANQNNDNIFLGSRMLTTAHAIHSADDSIVNIIPKSYFTTNGEYQKGGAEWGYFVKTSTDYDNNKISSVLLYDIFNLKDDFNDPDIVQIKPVFTWDFKYNYDTNVVTKEYENNYCLANPQYRAGVKYIKHPKDTSSFIPKNPGDPGYSIQGDQGYCIGSVSAKFVGTHKNFLSTAPGSLQSLAVLLGNIALGVATSGLSTGAQVAIGAAYTVITDLTRKATKDISNTLTTSQADGKHVFGTNTIVGYGNINDAKRNDFQKFVNFSSPTSDNSKPLLFKDSSDSINYHIQLLSDQNSRDYTGLFLHSFTCSIFNDNSNLFHHNPDFVSTISSSWAYLIGRNFARQELTIDKTTMNEEVIFGYNSDAVVLLKTSEAGAYDITLTNMPADTTLAISQINSNSGSDTWKDINGNNRIVPHEKFLKHYVSLSANSTYEIRVYRTTNGYKKFGGALLSVYKSDSSTVSTGSSEYGRNYTYRNIYNNGYHINNCFKPEKDGLYTIVASSSSSSAIDDTYITILDSNFKKIAEDDDGFGVRTAGVRINLIAGKEYFIISHFYNINSTGDYEVDIFKQTYLPECQGTVLSSGLTIKLGKNIPTRSVLVSQSSAKNIEFYAYWDTAESSSNFPNIYLRIYNARIGTLLASTNILYTSCSFNFSADTLYLIEFSAQSDYFTDVHVELKV